MMIQNTTGSFSVVGDGTTTTQGGNGSGGTIANKSGANGSTTANSSPPSRARSDRVGRMSRIRLAASPSRQSPPA